MNRLRTLFGKILFWASWPALYVYLLGSVRSRVVIEVEGYVLLLKGWHDGGKWALPGGGVHSGETAQASAVREVMEETAVQLNTQQLIDIGPDEHQQRGLSFHLQRYGCKLSARPQIRKQPLEVISLEWLKLSEITEDMVTAPTWRHLQAWKQHR